MFQALFSEKYANRFDPIGIIAGSGPEAGVDLWSKILIAARSALRENYDGDPSAPFVRVVSDPALGLAVTQDTERLVDRHLQACVREISRTSHVFSIACNALQARAKALMPARTQTKFVSFDSAVDHELSKMGTTTFFLLGSSTVMGLSEDSIYAPLKYKYDIRVPKNADAVDTLIRDIKLKGATNPDVVTRLESIAAEGGSMPVVLACTDFPLVPASFKDQVVIDATQALANMMVHSVIHAQMTA